MGEVYEAVLHGPSGFRKREGKLREALFAEQQWGDLAAEAEIASLLGAVEVELGKLELAGPRLEEAVITARDSGDQRSIGVALAMVGRYALASDQPDRARTTLEEALRALDAASDQTLMARTWCDLADAHTRLGDPARATDLLARAASLVERFGCGPRSDLRQDLAARGYPPTS